MTAAVASDADWDLFADWCAAAERPALPATAETVEMFLRATPARRATTRRRLRAIRHAHWDERLQLPVELPAQATTLREGAGWVSIERALAQLPTLRFPVGLRGRRDGWLIVLIGVLGLTRREAVEVTENAVQLYPEICVAGRSVPRAELAAECPACAVTRWLRIVGPAAIGYTDTVKQMLDPAGVDDTAHDCADGLDGSWHSAPVLAVAIDRHGWVTGEHPISLTAVSAIMRARQRPTGDPLRGFTWSPASGPYKNATSAELAAAYDEVDRRLAVLLKRVDAAVSHGDEMMERLDSHWGG